MKWSRCASLATIAIDATKPAAQVIPAAGGIGFIAFLLWCLITPRNSRAEKLTVLLTFAAAALHVGFTGRKYEFVETSAGVARVDLPRFGPAISTSASLLALFLVVVALILVLREARQRRKRRKE
jgi:hypothetical protein